MMIYAQSSLGTVGHWSSMLMVPIKSRYMTFSIVTTGLDEIIVKALKLADHNLQQKQKNNNAAKYLFMLWDTTKDDSLVKHRT